MTRYKYPKTFHLPFSQGINSDDKVLKNYKKYFEGKRVVITEKMDGENTTIYNDYFHSRSIDSRKKEYQNFLYSILPNFQDKLKDNMRICAEYMYAVHSIKYENLESFLYMFSIWEDTTCLSWDKVVDFSTENNISLVPVLYDGIFSEKELLRVIEQVEKNGGEGVVMRTYDSFDMSEFRHNVIKYVRKDHLQTDNYWKNTITRNNLKTNKLF